MSARELFCHVEIGGECARLRLSRDRAAHDVIATSELGCVGLQSGVIGADLAHIVYAMPRSITGEHLTIYVSAEPATAEVALDVTAAHFERAPRLSEPELRAQVALDAALIAAVDTLLAEDVDEEGEGVEAAAEREGLRRWWLEDGERGRQLSLALDEADARVAALPDRFDAQPGQRRGLSL